MDIKVIGSAYTGRGHLSVGEECQDAYNIEIKNGVYSAAL